MTVQPPTHCMVIDGVPGAAIRQFRLASLRTHQTMTDVINWSVQVAVLPGVGDKLGWVTDINTTAEKFVEIPLPPVLGGGRSFKLTVSLFEPARSALAGIMRQHDCSNAGALAVAANVACYFMRSDGCVVCDRRRGDRYIVTDRHGR